MNNDQAEKEGVGNGFFWLILLAVVFRSLAAIFAKNAALTSTGQGLTGLLFNIWLLAELVVLGCQAVTWSVVLRHFSLPFAYPFMSLVFVVNLFSARFLFQETVTIQHMVGVAVIMAGIVVICSKNGEGTISPT